MNIQAIGASSQARQVFAEKGNNAEAPQEAGNAQAANATNEPDRGSPAAPVETSKAVERNSSAPSLEKVTQAVKNINKSLQSFSQDLEFSVDSESDRTIVKVVDRKTKEVIRQIPSQETLEIAKDLEKAIDTVRGLFIKQQA